MKRILLLLIFAISFAYIESAVVVYLRDILYPNGFSFPIRPMAPQRIAIEVGREFFSLILLLTVAILSSKGFLKSFSAFCFIFGIWDISFYLWLKIMLDWPSSLLEWDILFLIPAPWSGPVIAPVIVSITLILIFILIDLYKEKPFKLSITETIVASSGFLSIFISFIWNASPVIKGEIPLYYPWYYLILGEILLISILINKVFQLKKSK
ncbi:MAG: hypothetical protein ACUVUG_08015 [Candidatus Aminicenantia bacterium]